jgi:hypothetical protein
MEHTKRLQHLIDLATTLDNTYLKNQLGVLKSEIAVDIARTKCDAYDELNEIYAR